MATDTKALIEGLKELWLTDSDLSYLEEVDPSILARLHGEVVANGARVHDGHKRVYDTMAKATRFIPNFMLGKLSSNLTPYIQARICECLEPKAAAALAKHHDAQTLGEISLHLDAKLVATIAMMQELDTLLAVTEQLSRKGLYRRLAEISDLLDESTLQKMVERIKDPERIAAIASHMQSMPKLRTLAARLPQKVTLAISSVLERQGHALTAQAILGT